MTITDRNLLPGEIFVATYKKDVYRLRLDDGEPAVFRIIDSPRTLGAETFKSLSAAGSAIMNGIACNGWRFWTREADYLAEADATIDPVDRLAASPEAVRSLAKAVAKVVAEAKPRTVKVIKRTPNQKGVEPGKVKWFCSACQNSFLQDADAGMPEICPEGHAATAVDDLAPVGA